MCPIQRSKNYFELNKGDVMIAHHKLNVLAAPQTLCVLVVVITVYEDVRAGAQCMCRDVDVVNKPILTKELSRLFTWGQK